jgi:hypothetical protein
MGCWGRMERISWTNHVRNEELHRVKEKRNILQTIKRRKANWIGRNCLIKTVIEGKTQGRIELMGS